MTTNQNSHNFSSQTGDIDSSYLSEENYLPSLDHNNQESHVAIDTPMQVTSPSEDLEIMDTQVSQRFYWWQAWQFWGILLVLASGGIGYGATSKLLKLPETESCSKVYWPMASASVRLYCAQILAENKDVDGLLKAIALLEELPENHPLRTEINRNIEKWATKILAIGEEKFQEGDLESAIKIAQQIPEEVEAHSLVGSKTQEWKDIWSEASNNYAQVESRLRASKWNEAFSWAVRLTDSKNDYWSTTKYQETIDKINVAQEESAALDKAVENLNDGNTDNLLKAINKAQKIPQGSYAYQEAQDIINQASDKLLARIETLADQQEWSLALLIINRIPSSLPIQDQVGDWDVLAGAGVSASLGTVLSVEDAIVEAEKIEADSLIYNKAQQLISRWTKEIEDIKHLTKARELAKGRTVSSYNSAIDEARLIPYNNPRYQEAQEEITSWRREIQIIEDRPVIERAKAIAVASNVTAWRRAIAEIKLVSSTSPLYGEASRYARTWRTSIERTEDQPILNRAIALANAGDYENAIAIAQKIARGRALSSQAQTKINVWNQEIKARKSLQQAYSIANQGTPDALARAILIVRQAPSGTSVQGEVVQNINLWSGQILAIAEQASYNSLETAIEIASKVPSGTTSYLSAQYRIEAWKRRLEPPVLLDKKAKPSNIRLNKPRDKDEG
ncbi:MAG: chromosome segregation ATPase [Xenococcaceae cyanobacterium MO_207.B15]|nr:chromosome segregation ATPase [Xenococcaceae cyanobacterium MO_207.B15]